MIRAFPNASPDAGIDWYSFLNRLALPAPKPDSLRSLQGASLLITGAGGSIGSALSLRLAEMGPSQITLLDASEQALYQLQALFSSFDLPRPPRLVLASVTNPIHLEEIFRSSRPEIVFHAAAHKHVPLLEENPLEAIANNALGTLTLAECAENAGVSRLVLLSTDKAVDPISILGATKRIAELITLTRGGVALRLGNVLGTRGSVSETFLRQISDGAPVTITSFDAERFFLSQEEAVNLLLASATVVPGGSLIAPDLKFQHKIRSLAEFLINICASEARPPIVVTGLRPGDKLAESLWSSSEIPMNPGSAGFITLPQPRLERSRLDHQLSQLSAAVHQRDLSGALGIVQSLVSKYEPSAAVTELAKQSLTNAIDGALRG